MLRNVTKSHGIVLSLYSNTFTRYDVVLCIKPFNEIMCRLCLMCEIDAYSRLYQRGIPLISKLLYP